MCILEDMCSVIAGICVCQCVCASTVHTRGQQNDGGDNQGTDDENDQQGDGYSLPVSLRRCASHQVLKNIHITDITLM